MKAIAELVVRVFDLIEAEASRLQLIWLGEARKARFTAVALAQAAAFLLMSVPLIVAGVCLVAMGLMWWVEAEFGRPIAVGLMGLVILAAGVLCLLIARHMGKRSPSS